MKSKIYGLFLNLMVFCSSVHGADVVSQNKLPDGSQTVSIKIKDLQDGSYAPITASVLAPSAKTTYSAASAAFTPDATPADVCTITGSATKTVMVTKFCLSSIQTTAGVNSWFIKKRSTANSGGTSTDLAEVPHDSNNAAGSATTLNYTVDPTSGTEVGNIWTGKINSPAPGTAGIGGDIGTCVDFSALYGQPVVLRGTGQVLSWNFNLAALPAGLSVHCAMTWTEE